MVLFIAFSLPWAQKETQRSSEYSAQKACVLAFISMLLWQAVMVAAFPDNGDVMTWPLNQKWCLMKSPCLQVKVRLKETEQN